MVENNTVKLTIQEDGIAIVTLSRVEAANALNSTMALELRDVFASMPEVVRVVILTGAGTRAFCAGADLKERKNLTVEQWQMQHQAFRHALQTISECQVPVIAAVNGAAFGGGLELALGCDFIYAATNARFALPEVTLGIMPGMGGTQSLPRAIGLRHAKEYLFTGQPFSAEEAYALGMVNHLSAPDSLMQDVLTCARAIAANAPLSLRAIKRVSTHGISQPMDNGLRLESDAYKNLLISGDRHEGLNAYNEKRKPAFSGK